MKVLAYLANRQLPIFTSQFKPSIGGVPSCEQWGKVTLATTNWEVLLGYLLETCNSAHDFRPEQNFYRKLLQLLSCLV